MKKNVERAKVLIESLPYFQEFRHKTVVVKYGGHAMVDESLKKQFALDVILLNQIGVNLVIIHGGGPQINQLLDRLEIKPCYVQGMRVTDGETMNVVEMVLVGRVNKEIVSLINHSGGRAVGLSGRDGDLVCARKMKVNVSGAEEVIENAPPELIDLGRVGEVTRVNSAVLETLKKEDFIPVIAPVGVGEDGQALNINADMVAGAIAGALKAEKLILLTDVEGVKDKEGNLLRSLGRGELDGLIEDGTIAGGMIPKVNCCREALQHGVNKTYIVDGRVEHAILLEMFTHEGVGTEIV
jgi:acetylglutamate kinase